MQMGREFAEGIGRETEGETHAIWMSVTGTAQVGGQETGSFRVDRVKGAVWTAT